MQFNAISIIDIRVFLLGNGKVGLIVEETKHSVRWKAGEGLSETDARYIPARFLELKLGIKFSFLPIKGSNMASFSSNCKMSEEL